MVNLFANYVYAHWLGLQNVANTFIAWVVSVVFAYFTNKALYLKVTLRNENALLKKMVSFLLAGAFLTLGADI